MSTYLVLMKLFERFSDHEHSPQIVSQCLTEHVEKLIAKNVVNYTICCLLLKYCKHLTSEIHIYILTDINAPQIILVDRQKIIYWFDHILQHGKKDF